MAALILDSSNNSSLTSSKPLRPAEHYLPINASCLITNHNSDDKGDSLVTSSFKASLPLSSVIIMSSSNPTNQTNGIQSIPQPIAQSIVTQSKVTSANDHLLSESSKKKISSILNEVEKLNDIEKLSLYLQLPDGTSNNSENNDKKKVLYNPFGKKTDTEVIQTYTWIQSHLEEDSSVSIPKHEVYEDYKTFCDANKFDKLCVADFGKAMKHIFPHVKPRRLGQRGNSKYCYSGLKKKILVETPELPVLDTSEYKFNNEERDNKKNIGVDDVSWTVILEWVEKTFNRKFKSSIDFARYLVETQNVDLSKALKNNENRANNNMIKCFISKSPTAKKKDIYSQMNRKLSDKKKYDNQNGNEKPFLTNSSATIRTKAIYSNRMNCAKVDDIDCNQRGVTLPATIKTEPEETAFSTSNSKDPSKVPTSCNSFINNTSPTIILLSGNQKNPNDTPTNGSTLNIKNTKLSNHTVSATANSSTIKYKPIQPKPANVGHESECLNSLISANIDKRRHSVSTPFTADLNKSDLKKELGPFANFNSDMKLMDNDKNYKRQIDEKEFQFMTKKRHVEEHVSNSVLVNNLSDDKIVCTSTSMENSDLKVNEIESEALYDYLNTNIAPNVYENISNQDNLNCPLSNSSSLNEANKDSFVQIRKLLENSLAHSSGTNSNSNIIKPIDVSLPNIYTDNSNSNSMPKTSYQYNDNSLPGLASNENANLDGISTNCSLLSNVQVPPSPNARRRAFSFQPISPRNTPTIPENSTLDMNMFSKGSFNGFTNGSQMKQMNPVAAAPSQPASESNSPFISPRNTPIPCSVSRSRNNSGQSTYSNYRQTSLQNFQADSGVSSISSSPFISPHSTPIPAGTTRIRPLDTVTHSRNMARVRHSSGPGGPVSRSQVCNLMHYSRSNSLSPMIGDNTFLFNPNFNASNQSLNSIIGADNSKFNEDLVNKLNVVTQSDLKAPIDLQFGLPFNAGLDGNLSFQPKSMHRQRHFSNPYGGAATNSALMKPDETESFKMLLNRSQSVPLNQMFQSNLFDSTATIDPQFTNFDTMTTTNGSVSGLEHTISKSYPATPLCNDSFKLPHLTSIGTSTSSVVNVGLEPNGFLSGASIEDLLSNNDNSVIQSGQDLIVSSVQLNQGINSGSNDVNATSSVDDLNVPSPLMLTKTDRDEFNDLLINDNVVEHFQSLCDNDFSNIDLENQANSYDDVFKFA